MSNAYNNAQYNYDNATPYELSKIEANAENLKERTYCTKEAELRNGLSPQDLMDVLDELNCNDLQVIADYLKDHALIKKGIEIVAENEADRRAKTYLSMVKTNGEFTGALYLTLVK